MLRKRVAYIPERTYFLRQTKARKNRKTMLTSKSTATVTSTSIATKVFRVPKRVLNDIIACMSGEIITADTCNLCRRWKGLLKSKDFMCVSRFSEAPENFFTEANPAVVIYPSEE